MAGKSPPQPRERHRDVTIMPPSLTVFCAVFCAVFTTSFLSGIFGMLGGMILMGLLLPVLPVAAAMSLHAVTQMASNGWRAFLWRRHLIWRVLPGYLAGSLATFGIFAWARFAPPGAAVYFFLGAVPIVALAVPARLAPDIQRRGAPFAVGMAVTALHILAGVSGAVLDIFFIRTALDRRQIVATKAMTQTLGHLLKLAYYTLVVPMAPGDSAVPLWVYGAAVAIAFAGTSAARFALERMSNRQFIRWSQRLAFGIGLVYLGRGALLAAGI